jgi:hypothetical protein
LEFTLKFLDHDDDGKISYSDLLMSLLPYKMCKDYRGAISNWKNNNVGMKEISQPPDEVLLQSFIDDKGNPMPEIAELWPRTLPTGIEFCLKRFFLAVITLNRTLQELRCSFVNVLDKSEPKIKGASSKTVNLTKLLLNLIQMQTMGDEFRDIDTPDMHGFDQHISSRAFKEYLNKICKNKFYSDSHMIRTITRTLDKDMDGHVSILDFVKSFTKGYVEEDDSVHIVTQILSNLKNDEEVLYSKTLQIKYQNIINSIRRPKSKGGKFRVNDRVEGLRRQIDSDESPEQNR